jgi:hypothetical protein
MGWVGFMRAALAALLAAAVLGASPAAAQELLVNRSFETPVVPANGNNFYTTIANWTVINVTPAQAQPFNVIKPWSGYTGNPTVTPTGGGAQYLDVNAASGDLRQSVTVSGPGMLDFSGWFSVRDNQQALSGLTINVRNSGGTVIATASTSFLASDAIGLWKQVSGTNVPVTAGTYTFEAIIPNPANFDLASLVFKPALTVTKTGVPFSDPTNGTTNPKLIPGAVAQYTISATSPSAYTVTNNTIAVIDPTPANMELVVNTAGGPAAFTPNASALSYTFTTLGSTTDNIDFSNNNGTSWTYTPIANANGVDPAVTHIRLRPQGTMAANSTFTFNVRYRIK